MSELGNVSDPTGVLGDEETNDTASVFGRRDRIGREEETENHDQNNGEDVFGDGQDDEESHMFGDYGDEETQVCGNQDENEDLEHLHQLGAVGGAGVRPNANGKKVS